MCKNLRIDRGYKSVSAILLTFCFQFFLVSNLSSQSLTCNNSVQVSLDENCEAEITPDDILEGTYPGTDADYTITIGGVVGNIVSDKGTYSVTVTYNPTGNNCWSTMVVEDKLPPRITGVTCSTNLSGTVDGSNMLTGDDSGTCAMAAASDPAIAAAIAAAGGINNVGYMLEPFSVGVQDDFEFVAEDPGAACYVLFYVYRAGEFDPNDPCNGFIAGTDGYFGGGFSQNGAANLPAGDYELVICEFPADGSCGYSVNLLAANCELNCTDLAGLQDGSLVPTTPVVVENCSDYDCQFSDFVAPDQCGTTTVTRTWICTDDCGNASLPFTEVFNLDPVDLADITAPDAEVELSCGEDTAPESIYDYLIENGSSPAAANMAAYPTLNGSPLLGAICNLAITYTDVSVPLCDAGCSGNVKVIRTWQVYDWCDGTTTPLTFVQIIKASDNEVPTITFNTPSLTVSVDPWGCIASLTLPVPDILHDNCDDNLEYYVTDATGKVMTDGSGLPLGTHTLTYFAEDCCGNIGSATITVTVVDQTPPVAVATQNVVVSLTSGGGTGLAKLYTNSIDNNSHDGCGPVTLEVRRDSDNCGLTGNDTFNDDGHPNDGSSNPNSPLYDTDEGQFVKFCCEDVYGENGVDVDGDGVNDYGIVKVWLRVFDNNGNYSDTWANVRVEDKLQPAIVCPPDVTIDCDVAISDTGVTGVATAYSACGNAQVDYTDLNDVSSCNTGTVNRRWFIVGNPAVRCVQKITKTPGDLFDGDDINWPADMDTDCADLGFTGIPTYSTGACDQVAYSMESDTFLFESGACLKILNKFTVIDWCQYDANASFSDGIWMHTQIIKVNDSEAPTLESCDDLMLAVNDHNDDDNDGNICEGVGLMLTNSAVDNGECSSDWLKWEVRIDVWGNGIFEYTYSSNLPSNSPFFLAPTSNGGEVKVNLPDIDGSMANHKAHWSVSDGCGNVTSCVVTFMVVDKKDPTPYCVNLSTALMENGTVDLWAIDFDLGASDNCTSQDDLRFTFSNVPPQDDPNYIPSLSSSSQTFTCDDLPANPTTPLPLNVYVWDEKDNFEFCTVFLTLIDNQNACNDGALTAPIQGRVATENGENIESVEMQLSTDIQGFPYTQMTNSNGNYAFHNNPMYFDYGIEGSKEDDYMNGVSTLDLVLIQKHILGVQFLNSPYKVIAADINNDANVSALDLIQLRKLILGIYDELPSNLSWRFIDESQTFSNAMNPFPFNEEIDVMDLSSAMIAENFVGVKIGDVNNTATANFDSGIVDNRSGKTVQFVIDDADVTAGQSVEVAVTANDFTQVLGYQFTLETAMELVNVTSGAIDVSQTNFATVNNAITTSWNKTDAISVNNDEVLFTMTLVPATTGKLSQMLDLSDRVTVSEAYANDYSTSKVELGIRTDGNDLSDGYQLFQNEPNPFNGQTVIGFNLASASKATITVFDVTGKVITTISNDYEKGYNEAVISSSDLGMTGVVYYQLDSGDFTATKKMIVIE